MSTELNELKRKITASKEIFEILKDFDSEEILDLFARNLAKVLLSAPSTTEQNRFLDKLEDKVLEIIKQGNINQVIKYKEKEGDEEQTFDYESFELVFEEINNNPKS